MSLTRLTNKVAELQDEALADPRRRNLVRARLDAGSVLQPRSRRSRNVAWTLAAAALAGAMGFGVGRMPTQRPMTTTKASAWETATETEPLPLDFEDGSKIVLAPRARARVMDRSEHGAQVFLERGRAHVAVIHRPETRWGIEAGPFEVRVTGTRFDMEWQPGDAMLAVTMEEGKVEISGCGIGLRHVRAGESVRFKCETSHAVEQRADTEQRPPVTAAEPVVATTPAVAPSTVATSAEASAVLGRKAPEPAPIASFAVPIAPASSAPASNATTPTRDWRSLASADRYADAFAAIDGATFDHECENSDAAGLLTLANVARLSGQANHAERALLALRRRFGATPQAAIAAFDLGMLSADQGRDLAKAARWFATYLEEAPGGPLAREALGRLMETRSRAKDEAGAREAARRYLKEYPIGPRADLARSLAGHE